MLKGSNQRRIQSTEIKRNMLRIRNCSTETRASMTVLERHTHNVNESNAIIIMLLGEDECHRFDRHLSIR